MALHIDSCNAADLSVGYFPAGEYTWYEGKPNQVPAILLAYDEHFVIEGTNAELRPLANRILELVPMTAPLPAS